MDNKQLIETFYTAFQERDVDKMASCYHSDIVFQDPAFGVLKGKSAGNMWRMLLGQADKNMTIRFKDVQANDSTGSAKWEADYLFSKTGRQVNNKISASFEFKDGLIIRHVDEFNFWKWSQMALGTVGYLLGFTPIVKNKVRNQALYSLRKFESSQT